MPLTQAEQHLIELINRARLDPQAEADRLGLDDLSRGLTVTITGEAKQALAPHDALRNAARDHSQWMLDTDTFDHTGEDGSSPKDRMSDAGYVFSPPWGSGENIAWSGTTGTLDLEARIGDQHDALFLSDGHRRNILNDDFREIGVAQVEGEYTRPSDGETFNTSMVTENFAFSGSDRFLTGAAYEDLDGDRFFGIGEGRAGTEFAIGANAVSAADAGGYALAHGGASANVTVTTAGATTQVELDFSEGNAKLDAIIDGGGNGLSLWASQAMTLLGGAITEAGLLGIADLTLIGNDLGNVLWGNRGDNEVRGGTGSDLLRGGGGDDDLEGGDGADAVAGHDGDDIIRGGNGSDRMFGGNGADTMAGNDGDDLMRGGYGNDRMFGGTGHDDMDGEDGNDFLDGGTGDDTLRGDLGEDDLRGGSDDDLMAGNEGNDIMRGGNGNDRMFGGTGNDTLAGNDGNDLLNGGTEDDRLFGGLGIDTLRGDLGNDDLRGDDGNDAMAGNDGNDIMRGGSGNDRMFGGTGADTLAGNDGDDLLDGGTEDDVLIGGTGSDTLTGGSGADVFVFSNAFHSPHGADRDTIADFTPGEDMIDLSGFGGLSFVSSYSGAGNEVRYNDSIGRLYVDLDGGASDFSVDLTGAPGLDAGDLIL